MSEQLRKELLDIIRERSYEQKTVTLASGRVSDFYVDCKQTTLHPRGSYLVGRLLLDLVLGMDGAKAVGGPTLGADPISTAVALVSSLEGKPIPAFIVRKEPKVHGTQSWIEGKSNLAPGSGVVVAEDVVTTGGSGLKAVEKVEAEGFKVVGVVALVDREEGGREAFEGAGYRFAALFTQTDVRALD